MSAEFPQEEIQVAPESSQEVAVDMSTVLKNLKEAVDSYNGQRENLNIEVSNEIREAQDEAMTAMEGIDRSTDRPGARKPRSKEELESELNRRKVSAAAQEWIIDNI